MLNRTVIQNALAYYDKKMEPYNKIFKNVSKLDLKLGKHDMDKSSIIFYDEDGKELMRAKYEISGIYINKFNMWVWAWATTAIRKNASYTSRKILYYGLDMEEGKYEDKILANLIRTKLVTSRFKIVDKIQLNIHLALSLYLSKKMAMYANKEVFDSEDPENYWIIYYFLDEIKIP